MRRVPTMTECYVAFLDLMGVKKLAERAAKDPALCRQVVVALQEMKKTPLFETRAAKGDGDGVDRCQLQAQAFSDNVVLFVPTEGRTLAWLFWSIRRLNDSMIPLQLCLRGAVTIDMMHWDPGWSTDAAGACQPVDVAPVAFGPGLVAAHDLESTTAIYPRILISSKLSIHIKEHYERTVDAFPLGHRRFVDFLRQDCDGICHFDVLARGIDRRERVEGWYWYEEAGEGKRRLKTNSDAWDDAEYSKWLNEVRMFIVNGRRAVEGTSDRIVAKYEWLARYFNDKVIQTVGVEQIPPFENSADSSMGENDYKLSADEGPADGTL